MGVIHQVPAWNQNHSCLETCPGSTFRAAFWRINALRANIILISAGGGLAERILGGRHPPPGFTLLLLLSLPSSLDACFLSRKAVLNSPRLGSLPWGQWTNKNTMTVIHWALVGWRPEPGSAGATKERCWARVCCILSLRACQFPWNLPTAAACGSTQVWPPTQWMVLFFTSFLGLLYLEYRFQEGMMP